MQTWWGTLKILVHDKMVMVIMRLLVIDDALGGGGACRVVGEGGECVQPACRGRGGRGGGGRRLLQLAYTEGATKPGEGAWSKVVAMEMVVMVVATFFDLLIERVMAHDTRLTL